MVQSIELLFDEETEAGIRASWAAIAEAGLPGLADHAGETNRPHVTVAVAEAGLDAAAPQLSAVFAGWSLSHVGLAVAVGAPLLFGGHRHRWVLARQVVPSRPLLTLHAAVHRALAEHAPDADVVEQTRPDRWTPHVSLTRRTTTERLGETLEALDLEPITGRIRDARLWDSPSRTVTPL